MTREEQCELNWYDGQVEQAIKNRERFIKEHNLQADTGYTKFQICKSDKDLPRDMTIK